MVPYNSPFMGGPAGGMDAPGMAHPMVSVQTEFRPSPQMGLRQPPMQMPPSSTGGQGFWNGSTGQYQNTAPLTDGLGNRMPMQHPSMPSQAQPWWQRQGQHWQMPWMNRGMSPMGQMPPMSTSPYSLSVSPPRSGEVIYDGATANGTGGLFGGPMSGPPQSPFQSQLNNYHGGLSGLPSFLQSMRAQQPPTQPTGMWATFNAMRQQPQTQPTGMFGLNPQAMQQQRYNPAPMSSTPQGPTYGAGGGLRAYSTR